MDDSCLNLRPSGRPIPARANSYIGCPMVRGKATWCRGLCSPVKGRGTCGRQAPHAMRSQIQRAIARYKAQQERRRETVLAS